MVTIRHQLVLLLYTVIGLFVPLSQTYAKDLAYYYLSTEEVNAFLALQQRIEIPQQFNQSDEANMLESDSRSIAPNLQKRAPTPPGEGTSRVWQGPPRLPENFSPTALDCPRRDRTDDRGKPWEYKFLKARCATHKKSRLYHVTCNIFTFLPLEFREWGLLGHDTLDNMCPEDYTCWNNDIATGTPGTGDIEDILCIQNKKTKRDELLGVAAKPTLHGPNVHCTLPTEIPGPRPPSMPKPDGPRLFLSEEAWISNGMAYTSPLLFIHDSTTHFGFDHAVKANAQTLSTEIVVKPIRGRIPSRKIEFCMKLAKASDVWVILLYTWVVVSGSHPRMTEQMNVDANMTTGPLIH